MAILVLQEHSPRKDRGTGSTPDVELHKGKFRNQLAEDEVSAGSPSHKGIPLGDLPTWIAKVRERAYNGHRSTTAGVLRYASITWSTIRHRKSVTKE
jgi:hypothetical protein